MYKMLFCFREVEMFALVEWSCIANKIFGSCVVYFGLLLGVIFCSGILLVVLCTTN